MLDMCVRACVRVLLGLETVQAGRAKPFARLLPKFVFLCVETRVEKRREGGRRPPGRQCAAAVEEERQAAEKVRGRYSDRQTTVFNDRTGRQV